MKKTKIAALLAAATMMFTACGQDTRIAATINGVDIPAGVYIFEQMSAFYEAYGLQSEEDTTAGLPLLDSVVEGVPARQWIDSKTLENVRKYAAINEKFASLGLSYGTDDYGTPIDEAIKKGVDLNWENSEAETYSPLGISKESFKQVQLNSQKRYELFMYYYGDGGEKAVPEDEIKAFLLESNAHIDYIEMDLKDGEGNLLKTDGKAERRKMAEDYIKRASGGEDFNDILGEYTDWYDALTGADANAENTINAIGIDPQASPEDEVPPTNDMLITKDGVTPSAEVAAKVFEYQAAHPAMTDPGYIIVESDNGEKYWVVKIYNLFDDPAYLEASKEAAIIEMKTEEFNDLVDIWTRDQDVVFNEKAIERYQPDNLESLI